MVFTLMCMTGIYCPFQSSGKTCLLRIWVIFIPPCLIIWPIFNAREAEFEEKKVPWKDCLIWSPALCNYWAGSIGLADRTSVPGSGIFSNKWAVLIEFPFTVGVVNQAVSADAVPDCVIAIQGTQATALQWFLIAVTAINKKQEKDDWGQRCSA